MLRKIIPFTGALLILFGCYSCQRSQDVVSQHWIQKRKHRPGFHIGSIPGHHLGHRPQDHDQIKHASHPRTSASDNLAIKRPSKLNTDTSTSFPLLATDDKSPFKWTTPETKASTVKRTTHSLAETAEARTNELEDVQQAKEANRRKIIRNSSLIGLGVGWITLSSWIATLSPLAGFLLPSIGLLTILFALGFLVVNLMERKQLRAGKVFFDDRRIGEWTALSLIMKKAQWISLIAGTLLTTAGFLLPISMYMISLVLFITGSSMSLIYSLSTYVGIIVSKSISPYSFEAKRALRQLILVPIISTAIAWGLAFLTLAMPF
jgi:uncharacterized membrane protein